MIKGIKKLPIYLNDEEAIQIYKKLAQVNRKVGRLDASFKASVVDSGILNLLSYQESVQSTRIEGTQVTFSEMMEIKEKNVKTSWQQQEVINYKNAIDYGVAAIRGRDVISSRLIKQLHKILMTNARGVASNGGEYRKIQNFIGPDNKIENASYIPVGAHEINDYMTNLEFFINGMPHESLVCPVDSESINFDSDALLRIAVAHAQFESIHPFLDGNGRLGRILIALIAVQENILSVPLFFVSEELEKERLRYYNTLNATRGEQPNWYNWIVFFLTATERMCDNLIRKIENAEQLANQGLALCKTDTQRKVWLTTFSSPVITASKVAQEVAIHPSTAKKALDYLAEKHLLDKNTSVKRNIDYYNYDLLRVMRESY